MGRRMLKAPVFGGPNYKLLTQGWEDARRNANTIISLLPINIFFANIKNDGWEHWLLSKLDKYNL